MARDARERLLAPMARGERWTAPVAGASIGARRAGADWVLTTAELRVLRYLPSHLSFRQIAERLCVSPNTVKTHARGIYRKLGVSSRGEAVDRARAAGLAEPAAGE